MQLDYTITKSYSPTFTTTLSFGSTIIMLSKSELPPSSMVALPNLFKFNFVVKNSSIKSCDNSFGFLTLFSISSTSPSGTLNLFSVTTQTVPC